MDITLFHRNSLNELCDFTAFQCPNELCDIAYFIEICKQWFDMI